MLEGHGWNPEPIVAHHLRPAACNPGVCLECPGCGNCHKAGPAPFVVQALTPVRSGQKSGQGSREKPQPYVLLPVDVQPSWLPGEEHGLADPRSRQVLVVSCKVYIGSNLPSRTAVCPLLGRKLGITSKQLSYGVRISASPSRAISVLRSGMTSPP